jgi:hypothetical protein
MIKLRKIHSENGSCFANGLRCYFHSSYKNPHKCGQIINKKTKESAYDICLYEDIVFEEIK